jgi:hypothetical protein
MRPFITKFVQIAAVAAAAVVSAASVVLAVRQHSWAPVASVGWLPAVIVAALATPGRRCLPRRARQGR